MQFFRILIILFTFSIPSHVFADEAKNWLKTEIDKIIYAYQNNDLPSENRFLMIEQTINNNFAGSGIAKFVAGKSWNGASKDTKLEYIKLFKRHLALNIASMMQGYSNQNYELTNSKYDEKNKVSLIDMEVHSDTGSIQVTWRVKKSKDRYFVIDLLVADISLVVTKRSEFNSMLKTVDYNLDQFNEKLIAQNELSYSKLLN
jgi:ABC-type transporter MlaC component